MSGDVGPSASTGGLPPARRVSWPWLALLLGTVAVSSLFAYRLLFSRFMPWDDEGLFLLALRQYRSGAGLYEQIRTIYGPFYFQVLGTLFSLLSLPIDNVGARWVVLAVWLLAGLGVARAVHRITGSPLAGVLAYALSFPILSVLGNEPLHPGGLIVLLLCGIVLLSCRWEEGARPWASFGACGALTAAIGLSKLNIGLFALLAFLAFTLRSAPASRIGKALRLGASLLLLAVPFGLMARLMAVKGIASLAILIAGSLLPFGFQPWLETPAGSVRRRIVPYLLGGVAAASAILGPLLVGATSPSGLWSSLVVGSLRFPGAKVFSPFADGAGPYLIALSLVPVALGGLLKWAIRSEPSGRAALKLAGGLLLLAVCLVFPAEPMLGLPLVWLVAVPGRSSKRGLEARTFLGLLVLFVSLQTYPVAGSQVGLFAFLFPAVGIVIVRDAFVDLPDAWKEACRGRPCRIARVVGAVLICAAGSSLVGIHPKIWSRYETGTPLGLRGAETLRLPEYQVAELRWVHDNLERNADTFVGFPGVHSVYGWTSMAPPLPFYPHTWILFYDEARPQRLRDALLAATRPCIGRNQNLLNFWRSGGGVNRVGSGSLQEAAERQWRVAGAAGGFEMLFPPSAHPEIVLTVTPVADAPELAGHPPKNVYRLAFPPMAGTSVTRITVHDPATGADRFDSASDAPASRITVLALSGEELLRGNPPALLDLSRKADAVLLCPSAISKLSVIRAFDPGGRIVARFVLPAK